MPKVNRIAENVNASLSSANKESFASAGSFEAQVPNQTQQNELSVETPRNNEISQDEREPAIEVNLPTFGMKQQTQIVEPVQAPEQQKDEQITQDEPRTEAALISQQSAPPTSSEPNIQVNIPTVIDEGQLVQNDSTISQPEDNTDLITDNSLVDSSVSLIQEESIQHQDTNVPFDTIFKIEASEYTADVKKQNTPQPTVSSVLNSIRTNNEIEPVAKTDVPNERKVSSNYTQVPTITIDDSLVASVANGKIAGPVNADRRIGIDQIAIGEETLAELTVNNESPLQNYVVCSSQDGSISNKRQLMVVSGRGIYLHPSQSSMYNVSGSNGFITVDMSANPDEYQNASTYYFSNPSIDINYWPLYDNISGVLYSSYMIYGRDEYKKSSFDKAKNIVSLAINNSLNTAAFNDTAKALSDFNIFVNIGDTINAKKSWSRFIQCVKNLSSSADMTPQAILKNIYNTSSDMIKLGMNRGIPFVTSSIDVRFKFDPSILSLMDIIEQHIDESSSYSSSGVSVDLILDSYKKLFPNGISAYEAKETLDYLGIEVSDLTSDEGAKDLIAQLSEYIYAQKREQLLQSMNSEEKVAEFLRQDVIRQVGFPGSKRADGSKLYQTYKDFLQAFIAAYDRVSYLIESVDTGRVTEFSYLGVNIDTSNKAHRLESLRYEKGVARVDTNELTLALLRVYPNAQLEKICPVSEVDSFNYDKSLFGIINYIKFLAKDTTLYEFCLSGKISHVKVKYGIHSDKFTAVDMAFALSNARQTLSENFKDKVYESNSVNTLVLSHPNEYSKELVQSEMTKAQIFFGPELTTYFNLNTPESIIKSEIEDVRSTRLSLLVESRIAPLRNSYNYFVSLAKSDNATEKQLDAARKEFDNVFELIGDSSILWNKIIYSADATEIIKMLMSPVHSFEEKVEYLVDFAHENISKSLNESSVLFDLELDLNPSNPKRMPGMNSSIDIKSASIDSYRGSILDMNDYDEIINMSKAEEEFLVGEIKTIINNPYLVFDVDESIAGEAISSILNGNSDYQSKSELFINAIHKVTGQGFSSDTISLCNDSLGIYNIDELSQRDVIEILRNNGEALVYDSEGSTYSFSDLNKLVHSRRFLNLFRKTKCVSSGNNSVLVTDERVVDDGEYSLFFMDLVKESFSIDSSVRYVKNSLMQHPTYCAMLSFFTEDRGPSVSKDIVDAQTKLANTFLYLAWSKRFRNLSSQDLLEEFYSIVGLETLKKYSIESSKISQNDIEKYTSILDRSILKYIDEIPESMLSNTPVKPDAIRKSVKPSEISNIINRFLAVREVLVSANNSLAIRSSYENRTRNAVASSLLDSGYAYVYADEYSGNVPENIEMFDTLDKEPRRVLRIPVSEYKGNVDSNGKQVGQLLGLSMTQNESSLIYSTEETLLGYDGNDNFTNGSYIKNKEPLSAVLRRINSNYYGIENNFGPASYELAKYLYSNSALQNIDNFNELNFMSLAEIMLVQDETGYFSIRPLDLVSDKVFDYMSVDIIEANDPMVLKEIVKNIVAITVLNDSNASPINKIPITMTQSVVRMNTKTSDNLRNEYELIDSLIERSDIKQPTKRIVNNLNKNAKSTLNNDEGILDFIESNYGTIVGNMANTNTMKVSTFGRSFVNVLLNNGNNEVILDSFRKSYKQGNTVILSSNCLDYVPVTMKKYVTPCGIDYQDSPLFMISFSDVRMSEYRTSKDNITSPMIETSYMAPNNWAIMVDDKDSSLNNGNDVGGIYSDSSNKFKTTKRTLDVFSMDDLFANTKATFPQTKMEYSFLSAQEIPRIQDYAIDFGVDPFINKEEYDLREEALDEFPAFTFAKNMVANNGLALYPSEQGIVGFVCATFFDEKGKENSVVAPVLISDFSPDTRIISMSIVKNNGNNYVSIQYARDVTKDDLKIRSGSGSDTTDLKFIDNQIPVSIDNQLAVDGFVKKFDNNVNQRFASMEALVRIAGMKGYNIALLPEFNPQGETVDESFADKLLSGSLTMNDWMTVLSDDLFSLLDTEFNDDANRFLIHECKKLFNRGVNPSLFLSSYHVSESGQFIPNAKTYNLAEQFESSMEYMNQLLNFMSKLFPNFCPKSLENTSNGDLFRINNETGPYNNCLQIRTEHKNSSTYRNVQVLPIQKSAQEAVVALSGQNGIDRNLDALNSFVYDDVVNNIDALKDILLAEAQRRQTPISNGFIG